MYDPAAFMYIKHLHRLAVGESKCSLSITSPLFLSQWLSLCHTHMHACFNKIWVLKKADLFNTSCRPTAAAAAIQGFYIKRKQSSQICQVTSWITLQQKPCGPFLYQNLAACNNNTTSIIFSVYRQWVFSAIPCNKVWFSCYGGELHDRFIYFYMWEYNSTPLFL